jgi:hypothetical protein
MRGTGDPSDLEHGTYKEPRILRLSYQFIWLKLKTSAHAYSAIFLQYFESSSFLVVIRASSQSHIRTSVANLTIFINS